MNVIPRGRRSFHQVTTSLRTNPSFTVSMLLLMVLLIDDVMPASAIHPNSGQQLQATATLTLPAEAYARVKETNPKTNHGTSSDMEVITANNRSMESYVRFTVSGVSAAIQNARLRVYSTTDGTRNGPAAYTTGTSWSETSLTW